MSVAFELAVLVADYKADFGVGFEPFDAVDNLNTSALKFIGTHEVARFVKAGLELDKYGDLLAVVGGFDQGVNDA